MQVLLSLEPPCQQSPILAVSSTPPGAAITTQAGSWHQAKAVTKAVLKAALYFSEAQQRQHRPTCSICCWRTRLPRTASCSCTSLRCCSATAAVRSCCAVASCARTASRSVDLWCSASCSCDTLARPLLTSCLNTCCRACTSGKHVDAGLKTVVSRLLRPGAAMWHGTVYLCLTGDPESHFDGAASVQRLVGDSNSQATHAPAQPARLC